MNVSLRERSGLELLEPSDAMSIVMESVLSSDSLPTSHPLFDSINTSSFPCESTVRPENSYSLGHNDLGLCPASTKLP